MKKTLILLIFLSACSRSLPETEVQKIFSRHSYQEFSPGEISAALKDGAAGLARLDPRASVLKSRRPLRARPSEKSYSSGLLLGEHKGALRLVKVFDNSSASAAGLRVGDEVLAVNGEAVEPGKAAGAIDRSTAFTLTVRRPGARQPLQAELSRDKFFFPQVFSYYDGASRLCFMRLGLFYERSAATVVESLKAAGALGAAGAVIDLRDNPGGVPAEAAAVLKAFAPGPGPVLAVLSRHDGYSARYDAAAKGPLAGMKVAVLVNSGTSMAAEAFARALKDVAGAVIVGTPTAGSVSMTRAFSLGDGRGLEIAVARLFPPSGADLESAGVKPDIEAGARAGARVWDNSRETTLLGDVAYIKALGHLTARASARRRR